MISPSDADRLEAYLDGRLSRAEVRDLEADLIADPDLAKALVARAYEDAALTTWASSALAAESQSAAVTPSRDRMRRAVLVVAALLVAGLGWLIRLADRNAGPGDPAARSESVAVLVRTGGAVWAAGTSSPEVGDEVPKGPLRLEAGVAQFEMRGGASVVIEGPADFDLRGRDSIGCRRGKLWARLASVARDFRIETPACTVVDRGTEFGLNVGATGTTEVHVLEGTVEVTAGKSLTLGAGRGARIVPGSGPEQVAFRADEFLDAQALDQLLNPAPGTPMERWSGHTRRLRADPRVVLYYPFENAVPANDRIRNGASGDHQKSDGTVVGCRWVEGRWPAKKALEFNAVGDAVQLNVADPLRSFTLAAWVRVDRLDRVYNALLMGDGWAPGCLHWQIDWRGQLLVAGRGTFLSTSPPVVTPERFGQWLLLVATRDARTGTVTQYVNGRAVVTTRTESHDPVHVGSARLGDWAPLADERNPVRTLSGRVDELLIVRSALTSGEVRAMYQAGRPDF